MPAKSLEARTARRTWAVQMLLVAVPPDVLFAGLEREAAGGAAGGVLGDADKAAGEKALVL